MSDAADQAAPAPSHPAAETHAFSAEVGRLLDLVVHSLYSEREIFLRELVANAADAADRRRFEALTDPALALPPDARVAIIPDKAARTITIADDGIGMDKGELAANLGTIARSGTRAFGAEAAKAKPGEKVELIGQFGVGFYSAFMVADRVEATSRRAGSDEAWTWASEGAGAYTLTPAERDRPGTTIVLHMKADADEFLEPIRLQTIVKKWADHITVPITVAEDGEDKPANEGTALWRKSKSEVTEDQYKDFYRHLGNIFDEPWATLHWRAEGALEFSALLFVPGSKPFDAVEGPRESRVRLHVRRMFITDEAGLLPPWLRFVQGVVDTEDLPLNVSREMLQATPVLARIRKAVTGRVISELKSRAKADAADAAPGDDAADDAGTDGKAGAYARLWENFGPILKEGIWEDSEHRKEVAGLMRVRSSTQAGLTGLDAYVARMKPGQEAVYFLTGDDAEAMAKSPQLEGFAARGIEVLLLTDPVDSFWPERLREWDGKPLRSVTAGAADLSKVEATSQPEGEPADLAKLIPALQAALGEAVKEVRGTDRLVDSAVVLAAGGYGPDLQMQRLMRRHGKTGLGGAILEVNPRHPLVRTLAARADADGDVSEAAHTLLDLARIQDGDMPTDPAAFARRITAALTVG